jgi:hypothetical protein
MPAAAIATLVFMGFSFGCGCGGTEKKRSASETLAEKRPFLGLSWDKVRLPQASMALAGPEPSIHILEIKGPIEPRTALTVAQS